MANKKSSIKRIDVIKRNTLRNQQYYSNVKTFIKKYFLSLEKYKNIPNTSNLEIALKNLSFIESKMDKATKVNVLSKNMVARKKSSLSFIKKYFLSLEKYKNVPNTSNLEIALKNLSLIYHKV